MNSRCPTVEARRKKILIVKYGSFSHVNGKVEAMLREKFPEHDPVVIDVVLDILSGYPLGSLYLRIKAALPRLGSILCGKHSPWDFVFAEPMAWKLISRWILRRVTPENTAFIFQTQSIFDASHPEVPFFIYTDHTREAHKRQPGGGSPSSASREWKRLESSLYGKAATVFTLSRFCARSVIEDYGVPESRVLTVSTGINMELPSFEVPDVPKEPVILFVGAEWGIKGGCELAMAYKKVRRELPESQLWLVGARPPEVIPGMRVFGRVKLGELDRLFRKATLVCVPSRVERASMLALDAAAYALPVITTPHGAGSERVRDGVTGLLVDPADTEAFADAIIALLRNPDRARGMGEAGRRMVSGEFTWEAVGGKIAARIRSLLRTS
jgi:glycosyltransferase involved in cell wall biosynthesis